MSSFVEESCTLESSFVEAFLLKLSELRPHVFTFPLSLWDVLSSQQSSHNHVKFHRFVDAFKQSEKSVVLVAMCTTPTVWAVVRMSRGGTDVTRCSHDPLPLSLIPLITRLFAGLFPGHKQSIRHHSFAELNQPHFAFLHATVKLSNLSQQEFPKVAPSLEDSHGWKDAVLHFLMGTTLDNSFENYFN